MSILGSIEKPKDRPPIITICGDAGAGKTRLAATFPNPIFIRAEDGMQSIPAGERPDAFPVLRGGHAVEVVGALFDQLIALLREPHDYKTLVIDSVTALDELFTAEALEKDGKAKTLSSALGGYGAGVQYVANQHHRVRKAAQLLNERRGMTVVFVAHADIETMRLPDQDDYQRWSLRLPQKSLPAYTDFPDIIGFIRQVSVVKGGEGERKRALSSEDRELIIYSGAAQISKNRYGITEPLDVPEGGNPLLGLIPGLPGAAPTKPARGKPAAPVADETETENKDENNE